MDINPGTGTKTNSPAATPSAIHRSNNRVACEFPGPSAIISTGTVVGSFGVGSLQ